MSLGFKLNRKELRILLGKLAGKSPDMLVEEMISNIKSLKLNQTYLALHISFLNNIENKKYIEAINNSSIYIDGIAITVLARRFGVRELYLAPSTDLIPKLLSTISAMNINSTVGLIGGNVDLVKNASRILERSYKVKIIYNLDGYQESWTDEDRKKMNLPVDILLIGMGVPKEAEFVQDNLEIFRARNILTCGGFFKFVSGEEIRAPRVFQRFRLEWFWRLVHDPKRLMSRYCLGSLRLIKWLIWK